MKKKMIISFLVLISFFLSLNFFQAFKSYAQSDLLTKLSGTIYYIERVDGVRTLFKADATLENKTLIYSHKGKGKDGYGDYNDNIGDFYYDQETQTIYFIAMDNGSWCLFSLKEGEEKPVLLERERMTTKINYLQKQQGNMSVTSKQGSLYLSENGTEKPIKKFHGIYHEKWTGYQPIGFSPDGKYLIFHSNEHLTPLGSLLKGFVKNSFGQIYIMDLSKLESTKYVNAFEIQWIHD